MPVLLGNGTTAPFRNLAVNWNRIFSSSLVNEVLVGYNQITIVSDTLDWAGIGNGNATLGIAGGQPIPGAELDRVGPNVLTAIGAGASDTDTVDKTFQINEKLTWLKGAHSLKFGGQMLHYVQQRFYAGNNGLLGLFGYSAAFSGTRLPISCSIRSRAKAAAASRSPGRICTTASRSSCRMISRSGRPLR